MKTLHLYNGIYYAWEQNISTSQKQELEFNHV